MGNPNSKFQDKKLNLANVSSDSVDNPCKLDPRSPTAEISRTPVQLRSPKKGTNLPTITKQQNLNDTFSTPSKVQTKGMLNSLLRSRLGANIDLRSPSANIDRTPLDKKIDANSKIVLEGVTDNISCLALEPKRLVDETDLESSIDKSITDKSITNNETQDIEFLECEKTENDSIDSKSTTVNSEKRKSYLETNIDCLETDLDTVKTVPKLRKSVFNTPRFESDTFDPRSPSVEIYRTPILQQSDNSDCSTPVSSKVTIINEIDPRSVTKEIYRTPISLPSIDDEFLDCLPDASLSEELSKSPGEENVFNLSTSEDKANDKLIIKSTKLDEIKKDFAKKYGKNIKSNPVNQVYEDKKFYKVTPRKALSASGRTPLSCVGNKTVQTRSKSDISQENRQNSKSNAVNDLTSSARTPLSCLRNIDDSNSVSKKDFKRAETHLTMINDLSCEASKQKSPRKVPRGISKIPTFKPKALNSETEESELTQLKTDIWDKDSSIVI